MANDLWPAPAKLNLFLHITSQRADGYHELQTVFQFLDYCDQLGFERRQDGIVRRLGCIDGVPEDQDLVVRAARLLQAHTGCNAGVDITLDKRIPMGGGLGGGSSDAATTLAALNQLWGLNLPAQELAALGLQLGADVPVFLFGHAAWAEGVGEHLEAVTLPEPWFLVISPSCHVATAEIFRSPELTRDCKSIELCDFLAGACGNVCEPVVRKRYIEVDQAMVWLGQYGRARMTGTGACIYAAFSDQTQARAVLGELPSRWKGFVAQGLNKSPLMRRISHPGKSDNF